MLTSVVATCCLLGVSTRRMDKAFGCDDTRSVEWQNHCGEVISISRQLWGCYAVNDHMWPRPFVADVLLYDRLVLPVLPEGAGEEEVRQWQAWDPHKQKKLRTILQGVAHEIPWTRERRDQFQQEKWSQADAWRDIQSVNAEAQRAADQPGGVSPDAAMLTRSVISRELAQKVLELQGDVKSLAVYASPPAFDAEWQLTKRYPFVYRTRKPRANRGEYEVDRPVPVEQDRLAKILVAKFAIPDDPRRSDEDMLKIALDIAGDRVVADRRAAFREWLLDIGGRGLTDQTIVREMAELVTSYNAAMRRKKQSTITKQSATLVGGGTGLAASMWGLPPAVGKVPVAAVGGVVADRLWGAPTSNRIDSAALLAETGKRFRSRRQ